MVQLGGHQSGERFIFAVSPLSEFIVVDQNDGLQESGFTAFTHHPFWILESVGIAQHHQEEADGLDFARPMGHDRALRISV